MVFSKLPKALDLPLIGLDMSDNTFKYVKLRKERYGYEVDFYGSEFIKEGAMVSGEIKDKKYLAEALRGALLQYSRKNPYVALALPEERGFIRLVELPTMRPEEIRKALELQLEEIVPMPIDEISFDYEIVGESKSKKDHLDVVISAFPKKLISDYMEIINAAGLKPAIVDAESHAVSRAVLSPGDQRAVMIIDFGYTRTSFYIAYHGLVQFTSTIAISGRDLDNAIVKTLGVGTEEARQFKKSKFSFSKNNDPDLFVVLGPLLSSFKEETKKIIEFWETHQAHKASGEDNPFIIEQIYLAGGESLLPGISEYLSQDFGFPVEVAEPWKHIFDIEHYIPPISKHDVIFYTTALGLAVLETSFLNKWQ